MKKIRQIVISAFLCAVCAFGFTACGGGGGGDGDSGNGGSSSQSSFPPSMVGREMFTPVDLSGRWRFSSGGNLSYTQWHGGVTLNYSGSYLYNNVQGTLTMTYSSTNVNGYSYRYTGKLTNVRESHDAYLATYTYSLTTKTPFDTKTSEGSRQVSITAASN